MKILFWNIIGMGNAGRRKLLLELIAKNSFDCIYLQETIKYLFKKQELDRILGQREMF
jgi:exonuclease III